ncbi:MAG: bifunctional phosphoribosylaminoimidazolecarboxamide formyltransferase/IMP cyclohydrolase [candidate division WOR-3 bacterium]|nr:bifunctional phosphoribosylaminoimidazolecarboxamide formyltransferase/IMP cyclohydrolase [candidate division WOR-3 bacterium]MCX7947778.1 bifunctional phosphoribosylaminoimidazolecarboxamide formyltransferase/IMP cyclohydrolase [candidate division WOR-3 bacterium]MDW8150736.1 bifunctional phosphoribosylaminoimidazolecarboxamide formyltransferase/IMP cyclohydrolase [candidate division WOR-3 bacterium]
MKYALVSVWSKENIEKYVIELINLGYRIISTDGTASYLRNLQIDVNTIGELFSQKELFDGRVKTLNSYIFGGILYRRNVQKHIIEAMENNIPNIELVIVELYPFENFSKIEYDEEKLFEFIDIGGISLIRAGAKNYKDVIVIVDLNDLSWVIEKLKTNILSIEDRRKLALKAFYKSASYDSFIYNELLNRWKYSLFDSEVVFSYRKGFKLKYGENPHQNASLLFNNYYKGFSQSIELIYGKELSYNNLLDSFYAYSIVSEFSEFACAIVKHNNPCGVAIGSSDTEVYLKAYESDKTSAYGGIVAFNFLVNEEVAHLLNEQFYEIIIAKDYTNDSIEILRKKKNRKLLKVKDFNKPKFFIRDIGGDILICEDDSVLYSKMELLSGENLTEYEIKNIEFGLKVIKYMKSNAILLVKDFSTVGMGIGQTSRIDALKVAIMKSGERSKNSILISDGFFPFSDSIELAHENGIYLIVEPGGSIRDKEIIEKARKYNIKLVFTGIRHFTH